MQLKQLFPSREEQGNTWTHLAGAIFALSSIWMIWPATYQGWQMTMGVVFFIVGMFIMFLSSTIYHWARPGMAKNVLRKCDHISIYVMIACSYTPICIGVIGGWLGWTVFALQWLSVLGGSIYKIAALGKYPRLSLALYLIMGWSVLLIIQPVFERLSSLSLFFLFSEGVLYSGGTYFFMYDSRKHFHAIWHIFVLLGAMAHWSMILTLLL